MRHYSTGQGGQKAKEQVKDQELVQGNLALSRSKESRKPVRVIRGARPPPKKEIMYIYEGEYEVGRCSLTAG